MTCMTFRCVPDVYDCKQWKSNFGPAPPISNPSLGSIKLHFGYDGFPAHNNPGAKSLVPASLVNFSLPPWLRYKEDNILISMLFPDHLSPAAQKKFFDKVIAEDFNPMFAEGVAFNGRTCKVEIFGHVSSVMILICMHAYLIASPPDNTTSSLFITTTDIGFERQRKISESGERAELRGLFSLHGSISKRGSRSLFCDCPKKSTIGSPSPQPEVWSTS